MRPAGFALLALLSWPAPADCLYRVDALVDPLDHSVVVKADVSSDTNLTFEGIDRFPLYDPDTIAGRLEAGTKAISFSYRLSEPETVTDEHIVLLGEWLPKPASLCRYESSVVLPAGFTAVSEGVQTGATALQADAMRFTFDTRTPVDTISLIASPDYVTKSRQVEGIEIVTYFFKEHADLSETYIDKTAQYLALYRELVGPYPYERFAIVENRFQTGYSMPTFTLIGDHLIDKSYLIERSLAHEIAHQWFGNGVFNDFSTGNWVEGLATYLSDHYLKERNAEGDAYRKATLDAFMNAVSPENDFSLIRFRQRIDRASMSIGYGKGMFLWHMLRREMGDEAFFGALSSFYRENRFRYADYNTIERHFSSAAGKALKPLFFQWLYARGLLDLDIETAAYHDGNLSFALVQKDRERPFEFTLPLKLICAEKTVERNVTVNRLRQQIALPVGCRPERLVIDPGYDLARELSPAEKPLTIASISGLPALTVIGAQSDEEEAIRELFTVADFIDDAKKADAAAPLLFVNAEKKAHAYHPGFSPHAGELSLQISKEDTSGRPLLLLGFDTPERLAFFKPRMQYYKSYSSIVLKGHGSLKKEVQKTQNGIVVPLGDD